MVHPNGTMNVNLFHVYCVEIWPQAVELLCIKVLHLHKSRDVSLPFCPSRYRIFAYQPTQNAEQIPVHYKYLDIIIILVTQVSCRLWILATCAVKKKKSVKLDTSVRSLLTRRRVLFLIN